MKVIFSLSTKIITIVLVSILLSTIFIGWLIYTASKVELTSSLKDSLERIAITASLFINGDLHQAIASVYDGAYQQIYTQLQEIKIANNLDAPIYTLKRSGGRNELECVVTTEPISLLGAKYKMRNEMAQAFKKGVVTSTDIYKTETGIWISAYAPIRNTSGTIVGILKAQRHAGYIRKALRSRLLWVISFCSIAFLIGSFLSIFLIRPVTVNIQRLKDTALALELGDYNTKIESTSTDEIGHLALTLEKMRISLNKTVKELKDMWLKEKRAHLESILTLSKAIEIRDPYTRGHIERVSRYSVLIAKKMGIGDEVIEELKYGCILHDLGKLDININILEKPLSLNREERQKIEMHPIYGAEITEGIKFLNVARDIILYHHERYDGKGYPFGLKGKKIPLLARIVSLADAFDAMVTDRPYRKRFSADKAFSIIRSEAGKQFDPEVCYLFFELKDEILKIKKRYKS